jgi:hypothetical protein
LATIMPLSMENESLGRPWMAHSRIFTGSPSASCRLKTLEAGMSAMFGTRSGSAI